MRQRLTARFGLAFLALAGVLSVALLIAARRAEAESTPTEKAPIPVTTLAVSNLDGYELERVYTGQIEARQSSVLSLERAGVLIRLLVDEGARVDAGDLLAEIDTSLLLAELRALQAERARARAVLEEMLAGPRLESVEAARARVRELDAQLSLAETQRERQRLMLDSERLGRQAFDEARFSADASLARRDAAAQQLLELENGERPERIAGQRALVAQLDATIEALRINLAKSQLRAPFSGSIAARLLDEGAVLAAGQPVLRLVEDTALQVRVGLPLRAAGELEAGQPRAIRIGARRFEATVSGVLPELDPETRTVIALLALPEEAVGTVFVGALAEIALRERRAEPGAWIPLGALVRGRQSLWAAYAVRADEDALRTERRALEVLHTDGERAFVRGLQTGDRIVADGLQRLAAGMRVRVGP